MSSRSSALQGGNSHVRTTVSDSGEDSMGFTQATTPKTSVTKAKTDNGSPPEAALGQQQVVMDRLKTLLERERLNILHQVDQRVSCLVHEVLTEVEGAEAVRSRFQWSKEDKKYTNRRKTSHYPEKVFQPRNSILTDLFEVKHISTIYHIFIVVLIYMFLTTVIRDLVTTGRIDVGLHLIYWNFGQLPAAFGVWLAMKFSTVLVYSVFHLWADTRKGLASALGVLLWDALFWISGTVYMGCFLALPPTFAMKVDLPPGISVALFMEQIRLIMKTYAFVRSNVHRAVTVGPPEFSKYLYFLFAPTLVYRDEYPRTSHVRWSVVVRHFVELVGVIFYVVFLIDRHMVPPMKGISVTSPPGEVLLAFLSIGVPSCVAFLCAWFGLLHAWMNAWAEMLRFSDRMFYQDWWNSSSFAEYYKTWNVVVHDWLYLYIYKDALENLPWSGRKVAATWLVFTVSALFHEYILIFTFHFFCPALFIAFGVISTCLFFVPRGRSPASGNIMIWISLCVGPGVVSAFYMFEHFARLQCSSTADSALQDFFLPRSWTCYQGAS